MSCNIRLNERITHLSIINEYQNITWMMYKSYNSSTTNKSEK
jgi:hypothetical protein